MNLDISATVGLQRVVDDAGVQESGTNGTKVPRAAALDRDREPRSVGGTEVADGHRDIGSGEAQKRGCGHRRRPRRDQELWGGWHIGKLIEEESFNFIVSGHVTLTSIPN
jgi:hypothetical protein